jgi:hypothetical protein
MCQWIVESADLTGPIHGNSNVPQCVGFSVAPVDAEAN